LQGYETKLLLFAGQDVKFLFADAWCYNFKPQDFLCFSDCHVSPESVSERKQAGQKLKM
jgi:hypothetical protein